MVINSMRRMREEWVNIAFNFVFIIVTFVLVFAFYRSAVMAASLLVIVVIIGLLKWRSPIAVFMFLLGALLGTFAEILAIRYGIVLYATSNVAGVPFWLFLVWGNTALFFYQMALEFERLGFHQ
jgi:hypothetical protein